MTNADTRDLSVLTDREIDALVAERVMGLNFPASWVAFYSSEPCSAFVVVGAMRAKGYGVSIWGPMFYSDGGAWEVGFYGMDDGSEVELVDESLPRAVCIAALRALEAGGE